MKSSQRIRQTLHKYQRKPNPQQGILGNEVGIISVPNRVDYVYVRVAGLGTISVYNKRVPLILDLPVDVGYDPLEPKNFQVLNIHRYPQGGGRGLVDVATILHGKSHNWAGIDPVFIEKRQLMPLRPTPMGGMNLYVTREVTYYDDKAVLVTGQQLDLSSYVPATGSWLVLVYKDTDEIIKVSTGGVLKDIFTLSLVDAPAVYPGTVPIALIRLYGGQSGIAEGYNDTDLIDVRQLFSPITTGSTSGSGGHIIQDEGVSRPQRTNLNFKGVLVWANDNAGNDSTDIIISGSSAGITTGTIADHDHSGDAGDGGQFPLVNLQSTGATSGQTAVSDGAGGIVWQTPSISENITWYVDGALVTGSNVGLDYISTKNISLAYVYIYCKDPGSAGSTIVDVNKNGVSIFTNQANRPTLAYDDADGVAKSGYPNVISLAEFDILSFDIDQVATGASGLSIAVQLASGAILTGWSPGWSYRKAITITNPNASTLNDFQVSVEIDMLASVEGAKVKNDLTDILVTDSDGLTALNFYRETNGNDFGNFNNWNRWQENPVLTVGAGGEWDTFWTHPHSIINNGGTLYLYYGGSTVAQGSPKNIGLATSTDGIVWTKNGGNPIVVPGAGGSWDDTKIDHFTVLKEGSNWYAWYSGWNGTISAVGYATSSDGITWTKYGSNPVLSPTALTWDSAGINPSCVFKEGSTYYMIYWGGTDPNDQSTWKIGLATSTDRITWSKSISNPVFEGDAGEWDDGVLDVHVIKIGSTYYMFYQGNTADQNNSAIGIATSEDLINWTRDADNPMSRGGNSSEWDWGWNEGPLLYQFGSTWYMYYMGSIGGGTNIKSIGLRKFAPTRLWVKVPTIPASGTASIYIYYGNSSAGDASNGANTFAFFDDFTGGPPFTKWSNTGSLIGNVALGDSWAFKYASNTGLNYLMITSSTFAPPFIVECRRAMVEIDWDSEYGWNYNFAIVDTPGASWNGVEIGHYKDVSNDNYYFRRFVNGAVTHSDIQARAIHAFIPTELTMRIASAGSLIGIVHDGYRTHSIAQNPPASTFALQIMTGRQGSVSAYGTYFDKVWVRAYAATDPTIAIGTEETYAP